MQIFPNQKPIRTWAIEGIVLNTPSGSILLWYIDVTKKYQKTWIFAIFGVNPLFCYVLSEILYILADSLPLQEQNMHDIIYAGLSGWLGDNAFTSFVYAFLFVGVVWLVGAYLYKKKIYIKI